MNQNVLQKEDVLEIDEINSKEERRGERERERLRKVGEGIPGRK